jgi:diaminopimelate decarboxylase
VRWLRPLSSHDTLARHADGFEVPSGGELAHTAAAVPGRPLAFGGKPSPFGMDVELLRRCTPFPHPSVRPRGLHAHLASGVGADGWSRSAVSGARSRG